MGRADSSRAHRRITALAAGALLSSAGCALPPDDALLRHGFTDFPGQVVRGTLAGASPCVGLMTSRGWTVLAWPARAAATVDGTPGIELDGRIAAAETPTELAGGFVEPGTEYERHRAEQGVAERCPADAYFVVAEIGPW